MAKGKKGGGLRMSPRTITNAKKIPTPKKGAAPGPKGAGGGKTNTSGNKGC